MSEDRKDYPSASLLSQGQLRKQGNLQSSLMNKKKSVSYNKGLYLFGFLGILGLLCMFLIQTYFPVSGPILPVKVRIPWFVDRPIIMQIGTSRVLEPLLYSGHDDRNSPDYKTVNKRQIQWIISKPGIITVDMYGRINALAQGQCIITVRSQSSKSVQDSRVIKVVRKRTDIDLVPKRVIKFKGQPANVFLNLQKIVERFSKEQIIKSGQAPDTVKYAVQHTQQNYKQSLIDGNIKWSIEKFADGSSRRYVKRQNITMETNNKDKIQYFIGDRYLADGGVSPIMIQTDGSFGVWVVSQSGNTTHIKMVVMTYSQKAEMMVQQTQKFVLRHGMASGANWNGTRWVQEIADNDGLWTSMYGSGQLMRYAVLRGKSTNQTQIQKARQRGLKSLKAVLLIANVAGRQGRVQARIRYLNNTRSGDGVFYSKKYLLKGKHNSRDVYVGKPTDGIGFYGVDADTTYKGDYFAGTYRYSLMPINQEDWSTSGTPATSERTLDGFMCRTFVIPEIDPSLPGGLSFRRHSNNTHSVLSGAHTLYDYDKNDHPDLQLGNKPIPSALKSYLLINGVQYNASDLVYKADTSTDQVIGHLFIYKIAYDILDDNDQEQKQLKELIRQTMRNFCQHLINNGYTMVDATGQSTKWTKLYRQFYTTDYTIEDAPLKAIQCLMSFKLAYYVTGQRKFKDQYDLLAKDQIFRYIDFVGMLWDRWVWAFTRNDDSASGLFKLNYTLNPSQAQIQRHAFYSIHFSDEQEAFLAYYLAFQLQQDPEMQQKYRAGINSYWHSISHGQNPLWYYFYQLSTPEKPGQDAFGQDLRETAAWQLSRHMIDTTKYQAFLKGSRRDVIIQGQLSADPFKVIGSRTSKHDEKYVNSSINYAVFPEFNPNNIYQIKVLPSDYRSIHKFNGGTFENIDESHGPHSMEPSTTYTLPYWLGVYHNMIRYN